MNVPRTRFQFRTQPAILILQLRDPLCKSVFLTLKIFITRQKHLQFPSEVTYARM